VWCEARAPPLKPCDGRSAASYPGVKHFLCDVSGVMFLSWRFYSSVMPCPSLYQFDVVPCESCASDLVESNRCCSFLCE
jgi:hypothetical protein